MARPYTIGFYDDSAGFGGTSRYLLALLDGLDRSTFHPVFFALQRLPWHDALATRGVELVFLRPDTPAAGKPAKAVQPEKPARETEPLLPRSVAWSLGLASEMRTLIRLFRKCPVDLLHSNNAGAEAAPVAARLAGVPRILATWHVESDYDFGRRSSLRYRLLERACMRSLDRAIAPSQHTKEDWVRRAGLGSAYESRIAVIYNGLDLRRLERRNSKEAARVALQVPEGFTVIGSVGRLEEHKGYEHLIRAMPAVVEQAPQTILLLAGTGPLLSDLRELAERMGVGSAIRFLGFVGEIRDLLEGLDIYVQPSLCEVTPYAVLEAAGMGLPVAGSTAGGIPEEVIDGQSGLLFPPRDSANISSALIKLVKDPALRERFGRAGHERVAHVFSLAKMMAEITSLYQGMLAAKAR